MKSLKDMVAKGALLLDEKKPGWERLIYPDVLDMRNGCYCVLGQIYGDFLIGVSNLYLRYPGHWGFDLPLEGVDITTWEELDDLWLDEIATRCEGWDFNT